MASFRDNLVPIGPEEPEEELARTPPPTERELRAQSATKPDVSERLPKEAEADTGFRSTLAPEGGAEISEGEALVRGVATGIVKSGAVAPGLIAGGRLGALGFAGGPVVGAITTTVGAGLGGLAGLLFGEELNALLAKQDITFEDPTALPEGVRGFAAAGETFGSIATLAPAPIVLAKMGIRATSKGMVGNLVNRILDTAGKRPVLFLATEGGAAVTSSTFGGIVVAEDPNNPAGRLAAEVVGGFLSPTRLVLGQATSAASAVRKVIARLGPKGAQTKAGQILQKWIDTAAEEGEEASNESIAAMIRETDFEGLSTTAAQRTGARVLIELQSELMELNRGFSAEVRARAQESFKTITSAITALKGTGDPAAIRAAAQIRSDFIKSHIMANVNRAMKVAQDAAAAITKDTPGVRAELSKMAEKLLSTSIKAARRSEKRLWNRVRGDVEVTGDALFTAMGVARAQALPRKLLPDVIAGTLSDLRVARKILSQPVIAGRAIDPRTLAAAEKMFTVEFMRKFRSELLSQARKLDDLKQPNDARVLGALAEAVLDDLTSGLQQARGLTDAAREAYDVARTFSREFNNVYTRTFVGATRSTSELGAARLPPELLLKRALATGEELGSLRLEELMEAVQFLPKRGLGGREAVANVELMLDIQGRLLRLAASQSIDPLTGRVTSKLLQKFINDNEAILDRLPERLKKSLQVAVDTEVGLQAVQRAAPIRTTKAGEVIFTRKIEAEAAFSRLIGAESTADAVRGALASDNPSRNIVRMARIARRGGEAAVEGLRSAMWTNAIRRATSADGTVNMGNLIEALVGEIRPGLPSLIQIMGRQKLMSLDQIGLLRQLINRAQIIGETLAGRATGRPLEEGTGLVIREMGVDTLLRVMGSRVGVLFAGGQTGPSLIAAQRGSLAFRQVLGRMPKLKVQDILIGAMRGDPLEPGGQPFSLLLKLLESPRTEEAGIEFARQMHAYAMGAGLIFLTDEDVFGIRDAQTEEPPPDVPSDTSEDEAADEVGAKELLELTPPEEEEAEIFAGEEAVVESETAIGETQADLRQADETQIKAKEGVDLTTLQPEAQSGVETAQTVFAEFGLEALVTSTGPEDREGVKSIKGTKHDLGQAFDLRISSIPKSKLNEVVEALKLALGDDYDVVLKGDHIHVEFDPKGSE